MVFITPPSPVLHRASPLGAVGGCNAARMTAEVCWITSKLSARSEALPWYRWM